MTKTSADSAADELDAALGAYRTKRDPTRTNEPFSAEHIASSAETWVGQFVVHLHDASRRHYDLRLQVGSTLKSFAVPKGPSLDPDDKRLAVQTEDHPFEYLDFEDIIPTGNYGAGPMIVWDIGTVRYLENAAEPGLAVGKLDFELNGEKLKGRFALVETGKRKPVERRKKQVQRQWLLLKKKDPFIQPGVSIVDEYPDSVLSGLRVEQLADKEAIAAELAERARALGALEGDVGLRGLTPMLARLSDASVLEDPERLFELKLDGVRLVGKRSGDEAQIAYRSGRSATLSFPEVVRGLRLLPGKSFVLDGELVAFDAEGKPKFKRIIERLHCRKPFEVKQAMMNVPAHFLVFDLLEYEGLDLRPLPLEQRKLLLEELLPSRGIIRYLDHLPRGGELFEFCRAQGLEGVVGKLRSSPYRTGQRGDDWLKVKCERESCFVVVGWTEGKGARGRLGALDLGAFVGPNLVHRGSVGSGLDDRVIKQLLDRMKPLEVAEPPAQGDPTPGGGTRHHVAPQIVVRVRYLEFSDEGRLRHPVFLGIVDDAGPGDCTDGPSDDEGWLDLPGDSVTGPSDTASGVAAARAAPRDASERHVLGAGGSNPSVAAPLFGVAPRVKLTNLDKVFWPDEGFTKGDLLEYYAAISDTLLPHLKDRPVMLVRHPDGIEGKSFYQWNVPQGTPDWIETLELRQEERDGKTVSTFLVSDADALLHIVNLGCIPIHVLACRRANLAHCDFLTIDFDLGPRPFRDAVFLSLELRKLLDELSLEGFPKTSGQSGLHVLIPMGPGVPFETAKILVELIGRLLQVRHPELASMERRVEARGDKVYIDTGQTGRSRTIVAPYSVRAHRGGRVSTPLFWDEIHMALDPAALTMFSVPGRVAEKGDPMLGLLTAKPDVTRALENLEKLVRLS